MKTIRFLLYFTLIWQFACGPNEKKADEAAVSSAIDFNAIAGKLVTQMALQPGERILFVAQPGKFDPLIPLLRDKIEKAGGSYLGTFAVDSISGPPEWETDFTKAAAGKSLEELTRYFSDVDLGVMLPGAIPSHLPYAAMQEVLGNGKGRTIHFHWSGAYSVNGALMEITDTIGLFYQNALLNTDYADLSRRQNEFEKTARNKQIRVTTAAGTDIQFTIGNRPVTKQDGDASRVNASEAVTLIDREIELPAGAIRVAPVETSVEGTIAFPDSEWSGTQVKGLVLTFKKGKVSAMNATSGLEAVQAEFLAAGEAGKSFRELALGFNPLLAIPEINPWIPYYGYGAGVVRLSLGDNSELGGNVKGDYVRWNFFTDCTVMVGEEMWVKDGKLIKTF